RPGGATIPGPSPVTRKEQRGTRFASGEPYRALREKDAAQPATSVALVGSSVRVNGPDHTAEFGPGGLEFLPHDRRGIGVASSRFTFRLDAVTRGDQVVWSGG